MEPTRVKVANGHRVEEFYWGGRMVVYLDNRLAAFSFERMCEYATCMYCGNIVIPQP